jgi:hypothetical protein
VHGATAQPYRNIDVVENLLRDGYISREINSGSRRNTATRPNMRGRGS